MCDQKLCKSDYRSKIMINENESFKKPFLNLLNEMGIDVCDYRYDSEKEDFC